MGGVSVVFCQEDMKFEPSVELDLSYLKALREAGDAPVDLRIIGENPGVFSSTVFLESGIEKRFYLKGTADRILGNHSGPVRQ